MALKKLNVPINYGVGLNQISDDKLSVPGEMLVLDNGIFKKTGRTSKRNGCGLLNQTIINGSTITTGKSLNTWNDELNLCNGTNLYSYLPSSQSWINKGNAVSCILKSQSVIQNNSSHTNLTSAVNSGLVCSVYMVGSNINYTLKDLSSKTTIVYDSLVSSSGSKPIVVAYRNYFVIFYAVTGTLRYKLISINTPTVLGSQVTALTDFDSGTQLYDIVINSDYICIVYNNDSAGISLRRINYLFSISLANVVDATPAANCITIFPDASQNVWLAWYNSSNIKVSVYSYLNIQVLAATTLEAPPAAPLNIIGSVSGTTAQIIYEITASATYNHYIRSNTMTIAGTAGTASNLVRSVGLASKCFVVNNTPYYGVIYQSNQQATYFILDGTGHIIAKIAPTNGGNLITNTPLTGVDEYLGSFVFPSNIKEGIQTDNGQVFFNLGVQYSLVDFASQNEFQTQSINNMFLVGGLLQTYDGVSLVEQGFHLFPENVTNSASTSGGNIEAGTRSYKVCYEWTDNLGQIMRSAPSEALQVTNTGSTSTNTLTIPTLRLTAKQSTRAPVRIVIYRTEANATIYYRITSITSPLLNSTTTDSVTYADTASDTTIIGNDTLYTTGGVIENIAPPNCSMITTYKNQLVIGGLENSLQLWISKLKQVGYTIEFSDLFTINVDPFGGDITAVSRLDDKLVIFKNSTIYYCSGDGFNDTGTQNTLSEPILVTTDVGCVNINSVVIMPNGIMFRASKGIYLLDRSLGITYIGSAVQDYNNLTISSALLIANENQVCFTTEEGRTLVYNYLFQQWSTFINQIAVDSTLYLNSLCYIDSLGRVFLEEAGRFNDNGSYIPLSMTTGWISFTASLTGVNTNNRQVFQRIYQLLILGEYKSPHKLKVSVRYDYNPTFVEETIIDIPNLTQNGENLFGTSTYGSDSPYGANTYGGLYPLYQFRINLGRQKCESISFKIEDIQDATTTGEGFNITNMAFRVGVTDEFYRQNTTLSAGTTSD